jgi:hypothetical protein
VHPFAAGVSRRTEEGIMRIVAVLLFAAFLIALVMVRNPQRTI